MTRATALCLVFISNTGSALLSFRTSVSSPKNVEKWIVFGIIHLYLKGWDYEKFSDEEKGRKMKVKILTILVILFAFVCQVSAESVWINSVNVIPNQPSDIDLITFIVCC